MKNTFELIEATMKRVKDCWVYEGKFQDMEELTHGNIVFAYASISSSLNSSFENSQLDVYAHPIETIRNMDKYRLVNLSISDEQKMKETLLTLYYNNKDYFDTKLMVTEYCYLLGGKKVVLFDDTNHIYHVVTDNKRYDPHLYCICVNDGRIVSIASDIDCIEYLKDKYEDDDSFQKVIFNFEHKWYSKKNETKFKFIEGKMIDMCHFKMYEGKLQDMEQAKNGLEVFVYANISDYETDTFEESEVRVYAHSFEKLYCAEEYELDLCECDQVKLKSTLIKEYHKLLKVH